MDNQQDPVLTEAARLWNAGFAILWLHPKSKRPLESGWTTGDRKDWASLKGSYQRGYNLGVRLGTPSKIKDRYLVVVDVDIKSTEKRHREEAFLRLSEILSKDQHYPIVTSGRGNGSCHYYASSEVPFKMINYAQSTDTIEVYQPSKKASKEEIEVLGQAKIDKGMRLSNAWEISIYSDGRQVVLPPSIHPDSGKTYEWKEKLNGSLPPLKIKISEAAEVKSAALIAEPKVSANISGFVFKVEPVELSWLPISDEMRSIIIDGAGIVDRSAYLPRASKALFSAGCNRNQVLTVLTDPKTFLGACAYDHAQTKDRNRAAYWLYKFTVKEVEEGGEIFRDVPFPDPISVLYDWKTELIKTSKGGGYKPCFMNSLLIFEKEFGTSLFHKDDFSLRRSYGIDTPWGGRKEEELKDEDITAMRRYVCEKYGFELEEKHIFPTITSISSRNHHHPVREYLDKLHWDGKPRLNTWLKDYAGVEADPLYLETISRKVICAMVARAYHPGTKFDYVLILEGPNQGEGKSRSIRALAGPEWAGTVRFDMDHKDFVLALQGRWITEISELSGLGRKNTAFVKAIVSEESDRIRHPYGRTTETLPRQGIFIGTTNHFQYLEDETGNRRFWPVRVGSKIDVEGIIKVRDQLFAEAKVALENGEPLYIEDKEIEKITREIQNSRASEDSWEEKIKNWFKTERKKPKAERTFNLGQFKLLDLFKGGPLHENFDSEQNLRRACRTLRRLGFYPKDMKGKRGHGKYWVRDGV